MILVVEHDEFFAADRETPQIRHEYSAVVPPAAIRFSAASFRGIQFEPGPIADRFKRVTDGRLRFEFGILAHTDGRVPLLTNS